MDTHFLTIVFVFTKKSERNFPTNFCNIYHYIYASTNSPGWERKIKAICEEFCLRMCVSCGNAEPRINCTCSQHPFFSEYFIITMKNIQREENCSRVYQDHPFHLFKIPCRGNLFIFSYSWKVVESHVYPISWHSF